MAEHHVHFWEPQEDLRCRRCGVPVDATGNAVYFSEHGETGWLPLCPDHLEEAYRLLLRYISGELDPP